MKVLLVPLDSRPCNTDLPKALCAVAGAELLMPEARLLGRYMRPADTRPILDFLKRRSAEADAVVVSSDMAVHGGLEMTRGGGPSTAEALARVDALLRVLPKRAVVFSTVTRGTITATKESELSLWCDLGAYNAGRRELKRRIPPERLADYYAARGRNHAVNKRLAASGAYARLLFLQDDAGPRGPHVAEEREITRISAGRPVDFMPGTDEACSMLVAAAVVQASGCRPKLRLVASDPAGLRRTALYEHRPFHESLKAHLDALGLELAERDSDLDLFVRPPRRDTRDLFLEEPSKKKVDLAAFVKGLSENAVLADCGHCNGADPALMEQIPPAILGKLAGFAAWNTASNTLGTALAHAAMIVAGRHCGAFDEKASRRLTWLRLVEDWLFQSVARPELSRKCLREGIDRFDFGRAAPRLDRELHKRLGALARRLPGVPNFRAAFPWGRLFEARII